MGRHGRIAVAVGAEAGKINEQFAQCNNIHGYCLSFQKIVMDQMLV